jgi:SPX domain protein involved in polyphosphate accumulation
MIKLMIILEMVALASLAVAEDFRTLDGREYKNVTVSRVEPDGIVLVTSSGISKLYFTELPKEVQERFHYDAQKAAAYSASQNVVQEQLAKVQQEATTKQEKIHRLEALYTELDQKEDALMRRIARAEVGQYQAIPNPDRAQLAFLHSELDKVRRDKDQVIQQLEQAQR